MSWQWPNWPPGIWHRWWLAPTETYHFMLRKSKSIQQQINWSFVHPKVLRCTEGLRHFPVWERWMSLNSIAVMVLCRTFHSGQITYTVYVPQPYYDLVCLEWGFLDSSRWLFHGITWLDYRRSENCFDVSDVSARKQTGHILVPKTQWKWYTVKISLQKINI
jgi:hypothetical protein